MSDKFKTPLKKEPKIYTTILSGKFKGKRLNLPSLATTRSTKSIVRASFFNTTRYELAGKIFIEGFGGSAVMACEAISNGASGAIAVERDKNAFKITQKNIVTLNEPNLRAINADSFKILDSLINEQNLPVILYLDPPFDTKDGFKGVYDALCELINKLNKDKIFLIIFEHASGFKFSQDIGKFSLLKSKKFGATSLSYFN